MDVETYARKYPHLVDDQIPPRLLAAYQRRKPRTCLDVGCGDGGLLHALERQGCLRNVIVHALDASPLRIARLSALHRDFDCIVGDACDLSPIADATIDLAISTMVIEHVDDPLRMLAGLRRVLPEDGLLYLTTVFKRPGAWYFRKRNGESVLDPTHVREYTSESQLMGPLTQAGLIAETSVMTPLGFPIVDPLLRLTGVGRGRGLDGALWRAVRRPAVRIPGYWTWEIVATKRPMESADEATD